jgi:hypothetical protein
MADINLGWDVEGILTPRESVEAMLQVIPTKTIEQSGTFWTWEGRVSALGHLSTATSAATVPSASA